MHIVMVTPAPPRSRAGNRATAVRWARLLRELGHRVELQVAYSGVPCDLLVALHAWRSADTVVRYRERFPGGPLVVALTGTDLYRFIRSHPRPTLASIAAADRLVTLHALAAAAIPSRYRAKVRTIYQSAPPLARRRSPRKRTFDVCVVGHLRYEKDPLRAAYAVRRLPAASRLRVLHYGKAHTERWRETARNEMKRNPRYRWFGELPRWQVRRAFALCRALVMSSNMEGGANTVTEAVVAGLPVLASDIPGNVGLLGEDYPGYYPVRDTRALRALLERAESDPGLLKELAEHGRRLKPLFTASRERNAWRELLAEIETR